MADETTVLPADPKEIVRKIVDDGRVFDLGYDEQRQLLGKADSRLLSLSRPEMDQFLGMSKTWKQSQGGQSEGMRGPIRRSTLDAAAAQEMRYKDRDKDPAAATAATPGRVEPPKQYGRGTTYATGMGSAVGGMVPVELPKEPIIPIGKLARSYTVDMPESIVDPNKAKTPAERTRAIFTNAAYGTARDTLQLTADKAEGFTTPDNVAILAGMALLPEAGIAKILVEAGFTAQMAAAAASGFKGAHDKWHETSGDATANKMEAGKLAASAVVDMILAAGAAKGAKENIATRAKLQRLTKSITDMGLAGLPVRPEVEEAAAGSRHYRDLERGMPGGVADRLADQSQRSLDAEYQQPARVAPEPGLAALPDVPKKVPPAAPARVGGFSPEEQARVDRARFNLEGKKTVEAKEQAKADEEFVAQMKSFEESETKRAAEQEKLRAQEDSARRDRNAAAVESTRKKFNQVKDERFAEIEKMEKEYARRRGADALGEIQHQSQGRGFGDEQYHKHLSDLLYETIRQDATEARPSARPPVEPLPPSKRAAAAPPPVSQVEAPVPQVPAPVSQVPPAAKAGSKKKAGPGKVEPSVEKPAEAPLAAAPPPAATPTAPETPVPTPPSVIEAPGLKKPEESADAHIPKGQPLPAHMGKETTVLTPAGNYPAHYRVVELDHLTQSHDPFNFTKNEKYPYVNDRAYHQNKEAQKNVVENAQKKEFQHFINQDPTANTGPSQSLPDGTVLGGNGRTMQMKRIYQAGDGAEYRQYLMDHAAEFGLDPAEIAKMKQPVLDRMLDNVPDVQKAITALNPSFGKGMTEIEKAVMWGRNLSSGSVDKITSALEDLGDESSLRKLMGDPKNAPMIREIMLKDGMVSDEKDLSDYFTKDGVLNDTGKNLFENAMLGSVITDVDLLAGIPPATRAKLERILPSLIELSARSDIWNLIEPIRAIISSKVRGMTLDDFFAQHSMFDEDARADTKLLAKLIDEEKPLALAKRFRQFVADARQDIPEQEMLFGRPDPRKAFREAFGERIQEAITNKELSIADLEALASMMEPPPKPGELQQASVDPAKLDMLFGVSKKLAAQGFNTPEKLRAKLSELTKGASDAYMPALLDKIRQEAKGEREAPKAEAKPAEFRPPQPAPKPSEQRPAAKSEQPAAEQPGRVEPGKPSDVDIQPAAGQQSGGRPGQPASAVDYGAIEKERAIVLNEHLLPDVDVNIVPKPRNLKLTDEQNRGAAIMINAMVKHGGALLADGTGFGKTPSIAAISKHFIDKGHAVLIISPAEVFKFEGERGKERPTGSYATWLPEFGIEPIVYRGTDTTAAFEPGKVYLSAFYPIGDAPVDGNTIVVFDESHAIKNQQSSARAKKGKDITQRAKAVLFASATPADKPQSIVYLDRMGITDGRGDQAYRDIGLIKRQDKSTKEFNWVVNPKVGIQRVWENIDKLFTKMTAEGRMVRRELSWAGHEVRIDPLEVDPKMHDVSKFIEDELTDGLGMDGVSGRWKATIMGHIRRAEETFKVPTTLKWAKKELDEGRSVLIVMSRINRSDVQKTITLADGSKTKETIYSSPGTAELLRKGLMEMGLKHEEIVDVHGNAEESSQDAMGKFQSNKARVVLLTAESGGTGVSFDDIHGTHPRTMIIMTAPFGGDVNAQLLGRINRMTTKSKARAIYGSTGTNIDTHNLTTAARKMLTLKAVVTGGELGKMGLGQLIEGEKPAPKEPGRVTTTRSATSNEGAKPEVKGGPARIPTNPTIPTKPAPAPVWSKMPAQWADVKMPDRATAERAKAHMDAASPGKEFRILPKLTGGFELEWRHKAGEGKPGLYQEDHEESAAKHEANLKKIRDSYAREAEAIPTRFPYKDNPELRAQALDRNKQSEQKMIELQENMHAGNMARQNEMSSFINKSMLELDKHAAEVRKKFGPKRVEGTLVDVTPEVKQLPAGPPDHTEAVKAGGGKYKTIWDAEGFGPNLLLFDDPQTGSTLAIPADTPGDKITEAVRARIEDSRKLFQDDPEKANLMKVGQKILGQAKDRADWESRMVKAMGPRVRADLHDVWEEITGAEKKDGAVVGPEPGRVAVDEKFTFDKWRDIYQKERAAGNVPDISPEQFEGVMALYAANARMLGLSLDDYAQRYLGDVQYGWDQSGGGMEQRASRVQGPGLFGDDGGGTAAKPSRVTPPPAQMGLVIPGMAETLEEVQRTKEGIQGQKLTAAQYQKKKGGSLDDSPLFRKPESMLFSPKGVIHWGEDGRAIQRFAKSADVSTMLHEGFHLWRRLLGTEDLAILAKWVGAKKVDGVWQFTIDHEEQFARGGEKYGRDGKAPTKEMQPLFDKFATWMRDIYRRLTGSPLAMKIPPEMRGVYDRLFTEPNEPARVGKAPNPEEAGVPARVKPILMPSDVHDIVERPKVTLEDFKNKGDIADLEKGIIRERGSVRSAQFAAAQKAVTEGYKQVEKMPLNDQLEWNYWMDEKGLPEGYKGSLEVKDPATRKIRDGLTYLREQIDWRWNLLKDLSVLRKEVEDNPNYWPHRFRQSRDEGALESWLSQRAAHIPVAPKAGSMRERFLQGTYRDKINDLGLTPDSYNPFDNALSTIAELDRFIAGYEIFKENKDRGLAKIVPAVQIPGGPIAPTAAGKAMLDQMQKETGSAWEQYKDPVAVVKHFNAEEQRPVVTGVYYGPKEATRIFNNYTEKSIMSRHDNWFSIGGVGVGPGSIARGVRTANVVSAMASVSLSAFHAGLVETVSAGESMGLAMQHAFEAVKNLDDPKEAMKHLGSAGSSALEGLVPGAAVTRNVLQGRRAMNELIEAAGGARAFTEHELAVLRGGTRFQVDSMWDQHFTRTARRAFKEVVEKQDWSQTPKLLAAIPAGMEIASTPIIRKLVPLAKMGATFKLAAFEMDKLGPNATPEQIRSAMGRVTSEIDNRYGQMVRDNMFMPRVLADALSLTFNYMDFNYGTIRAMVGDPVAAVREGNWRQTIAGDVEKLVVGDRKNLSSKDGGETWHNKRELTHRLAFVAGLSFVLAARSALWHALALGQDPSKSDTKGLDVVSPRDGGQNPDGSPSRFMWPSYAKSAWQWGKPIKDVATGQWFDILPDIAAAAKGRLAFTPRILEELVTNQNYQGQQMRDPNAPVLSQARQFFTKMLKDSIPIGLAQAIKSAKEGEAPGRVAARIAGFTPPPAAITRSDAESFIMSKTGGHGGALSEDAAALRDEQQSILQRLRNKAMTEDDLWRDVDAGKIAEKDAEKIVKRFRDNPSVLDRAKSLNAKDFVQVYGLATPAEKVRLRTILEGRREAGLFNSVPLAERPEVEKQIEQILATPPPQPARVQ